MASSHAAALRPVAFLMTFLMCTQEVALAAPEASALLQNLTHPLVSFELPASVGTIEDSHRGDISAPKIILIQDAHTNPSGQKNAAQAIRLILEKEPVTHVFAEGASGDLSIGFLKERFSREVLEKAGEPFVNKSLLKGSELANLTAAKDFTLWGIEDQPLYDRALEAYRAAAEGRDHALALLDRIDRSIETLKGQFYSADLQKLDRLKRSYDAGETALTDYFLALDLAAENAGVDTATFGELKTLKRLKSGEDAIDFGRAAEEEAAAIAALPEADRAEIAKMKAPLAKVSHSAHEDTRAFFFYLAEKVVSLNEFPQLSKYVAYLRLSQTLKADRVVAELGRLEEAVFQTMTPSADAKGTMLLSRGLAAEKKLLSLQITPDEYAFLKSNPQLTDVRIQAGFVNKKILDLKKHYDRVIRHEPALAEAVASADAFYRTAFERDQAFVRNLAAKTSEGSMRTVILVTGGFHARHLKELFESRGWSYVSVIPSVYQETDHARYEKMLLQAPRETRVPAVRVSALATTLDTPNYARFSADVLNGIASAAARMAGHDQSWNFASGQGSVEPSILRGMPAPTMDGAVFARPEDPSRQEAETPSPNFFMIGAANSSNGTGGSRMAAGIQSRSVDGYDVIELTDPQGLGRIEIATLGGNILTYETQSDGETTQRIWHEGRDASTGRVTQLLTDPARPVGPDNLPKRGGAPFMGPWVGRRPMTEDVAANSLIRTVPSADQSEKFAIHGFFDKMRWTRVDSQEDQNATSVTLMADTKDLPEVFGGSAEYHGAYRIYLTYTVSGGELTVTTRVENYGDTDVLIGFGHHPWFLMPQPLQVTGSIPAASLREVEASGLANDNVSDVLGTDWDYRDGARPLIRMDKTFTGLSNTGLGTVVSEFANPAAQERMTLTQEGYENVHVFVPDNPKVFPADIVAVEPTTARAGKSGQRIKARQSIQTKWSVRFQSDGARMGAVKSMADELHHLLPKLELIHQRIGLDMDAGFEYPSKRFERLVSEGYNRHLPESILIVRSNIRFQGDSKTVPPGIHHMRGVLHQFLQDLDQEAPHWQQHPDFNWTELALAYADIEAFVGELDQLIERYAGARMAGAPTDADLIAALEEAVQDLSTIEKVEEADRKFKEIMQGRDPYGKLEDSRRRANNLIVTRRRALQVEKAMAIAKEMTDLTSALNAESDLPAILAKMAELARSCPDAHAARSIVGPVHTAAKAKVTSESKLREGRAITEFQQKIFAFEKELPRFVNLSRPIAMVDEMLRDPSVTTRIKQENLRQIRKGFMESVQRLAKERMVELGERLRVLHASLKNWPSLEELAAYQRELQELHQLPRERGLVDLSDKETNKAFRDRYDVALQKYNKLFEAKQSLRTWNYVHQILNHLDSEELKSDPETVRRRIENVLDGIQDDSRAGKKLIRQVREHVNNRISFEQSKQAGARMAQDDPAQIVLASTSGMLTREELIRAGATEESILQALNDEKIERVELAGQKIVYRLYRSGDRSGARMAAVEYEVDAAKYGFAKLAIRVETDDAADFGRSRHTVKLVTQRPGNALDYFVTVLMLPRTGAPADLPERMKQILMGLFQNQPEGNPRYYSDRNTAALPADFSKALHQEFTSGARMAAMDWTNWDDETLVRNIAAYARVLKSRPEMVRFGPMPSTLPAVTDLDIFDVSSSFAVQEGNFFRITLERSATDGTYRSLKAERLQDGQPVQGTARTVSAPNKASDGFNGDVKAIASGLLAAAKGARMAVVRHMSGIRSVQPMMERPLYEKSVSLQDLKRNDFRARLFSYMKTMQLGTMILPESDNQTEQSAGSLEWWKIRDTRSLAYESDVDTVLDELVRRDSRLTNSRYRIEVAKYELTDGSEDRAVVITRLREDLGSPIPVDRDPLQSLSAFAPIPPVSQDTYTDDAQLEQSVGARLAAREVRGGVEVDVEASRKAVVAHLMPGAGIAVRDGEANLPLQKIEIPIHSDRHVTLVAGDKKYDYNLRYVHHEARNRWIIRLEPSDANPDVLFSVSNFGMEQPMTDRVLKFWIPKSQSESMKSLVEASGAKVTRVQSSGARMALKMSTWDRDEAWGVLTGRLIEEFNGNGKALKPWKKHPSTTIDDIAHGVTVSLREDLQALQNETSGFYETGNPYRELMSGQEDARLALTLNELKTRIISGPAKKSFDKDLRSVLQVSEPPLPQNQAAFKDLTLDHNNAVHVAHGPVESIGRMPNISAHDMLRQLDQRISRSRASGSSERLSSLIYRATFEPAYTGFSDPGAGYWTIVSIGKNHTARITVKSGEFWDEKSDVYTAWKVPAGISPRRLANEITRRVNKIRSQSPAAIEKMLNANITGIIRSAAAHKWYRSELKAEKDKAGSTAGARMALERLRRMGSTVLTMLSWDPIGVVLFGAMTTASASLLVSTAVHIFFHKVWPSPILWGTGLLGAAVAGLSFHGLNREWKRINATTESRIAEAEQVMRDIWGQSIDWTVSDDAERSLRQPIFDSVIPQNREIYITSLHQRIRSWLAAYDHLAPELFMPAIDPVRYAIAEEKYLEAQELIRQLMVQIAAQKDRYEGPYDAARDLMVNFLNTRHFLIELDRLESQKRSSGARMAEKPDDRAILPAMPPARMDENPGSRMASFKVGEIQILDDIELTYNSELLEVFRSAKMYGFRRELTAVGYQPIVTSLSPADPFTAPLDAATLRWMEFRTPETPFDETSYDQFMGYVQAKMTEKYSRIPAHYSLRLLRYVAGGKEGRIFVITPIHDDAKVASGSRLSGADLQADAVETFVRKAVPALQADETAEFDLAEFDASNGIFNLLTRILAMRNGAIRWKFADALDWNTLAYAGEAKGSDGAALMPAIQKPWNAQMARQALQKDLIPNLKATANQPVVLHADGTILRGLNEQQMQRVFRSVQKMAKVLGVYVQFEGQLGDLSAEGIRGLDNPIHAHLAAVENEAELEAGDTGMLAEVKSGRHIPFTLAVLTEAELARFKTVRNGVALWREGRGSQMLFRRAPTQAAGLAMAEVNPSDPAQMLLLREYRASAFLSVTDLFELFQMADDAIDQSA